MDCPVCGEPEMILWPGEYYEEDGYRETDMHECPECVHAEEL